MTDKNRRERVDACIEISPCSRKVSILIGDVVVIGDESLIYWRQIRQKLDNACWIGENKSVRTLVLRKKSSKGEITRSMPKSPKEEFAQVFSK